nr:Uncharacterized protein/Odorant-binding related protein [Metisa plana]
MRILIVLFLFVWTECRGEEVDKRECMKLLHPKSLRCCKTDPMKSFFKHDEDLKECFHGRKGPPPKYAHGPPTPPPCDMEICVAKKKGYLNEDGSINKEALRSIIEKDLAGNPTLVSGITKKCIEGDLDDYAPADFCDLHKLRHCILLQSYDTCPDWDEENVNCADIKDLVEKCQA